MPRVPGVGLGQSYLECSCWEHQVLRLEAPADSLGPVHVLSAWFGHPTREELRVDVTDQLRAVAESASIVVSAANLGIGADGYGNHGRSKNSSSARYLKKLWVSCCYRWLDEGAEEVCSLLAEKATEEVHATDPRLAKLQQQLTEPHGPLLSSAAEHQLQILQLQSASSLALEGLLYLSERRQRVFIQAAASITSHGFPFAYVACRAAQSLARALRLCMTCASDGLASSCASKAEVRDFMQQCLRYGSQLVFERLFGEFFKHVHAEWLAHHHTFHDASVDYLHQLIKVAHEELLDLLSRHAKDFHGVLLAARLAFCPLCLRPLQQFPDEVGALVDGQGRRLESTLYHRRCVFHLADGWCGAGGCDATWAAEPPPLLMQKTGVAQGWWPTPPLTAASDWAKFVASGACLGQPLASLAVPMEHVAVTLAASLPVHAKQLLRDLQHFHTCNDGEGCFVQDIACCCRHHPSLFFSFEDLNTLESIASWALQQAVRLDWWAAPPLASLSETSLEHWSAWFRQWDIEKNGHLTCGALALALGQQVAGWWVLFASHLSARQRSDPSCAAVRTAADTFPPAAMSDPLEEVLPLLCSLGGLQKISFGRFLSEVAASASELLRRAKQKLVTLDESFSLRHLSSQQPESVAATPGPHDSPKEDRRCNPKDADKSRCRLTFIGLCGRRRVAHLAPELPLQLRPLLLGLAADSLGFALVQETLGEVLETLWKTLGRHLEDTWKTLGRHLEDTWKTFKSSEAFESDGVLHLFWAGRELPQDWGVLGAGLGWEV
eukprot:s1509_g12.t1